MPGEQIVENMPRLLETNGALKSTDARDSLASLVDPRLPLPYYGLGIGCGSSSFFLIPSLWRQAAQKFFMASKSFVILGRPGNVARKRWVRAQCTDLNRCDTQ